MNWQQKVLIHRWLALKIKCLGTLRWLLPSPGNGMFTFLIIGGLFWVQSVRATSVAAPMASIGSTSTIPYQGRLVDANDAPLNGTYNMIFRLYKVASAGTILWEEQWTGPNSVQVSNGLFNVMLGSVTTIPQGVIGGNSNLFLGITVGTDAEMTPRVQLGSIPFAVQALTVPDGSITTTKIGDGAVTQSKLAVALPSILGQKTCDDCGEVTESLAQWNPVKGANSNDLIETTVTTHGGNIMVSMTARFAMNPASNYMCGISVLQNGNQLRTVRLEGNPYSAPSSDWACSSTYLFTGLPAGTYIFRAVAWVGASTTAVTWSTQRQIAVYEF